METLKLSHLDAAAAPAVEDRLFVDVLRGMIGKPVTIVNPESFENAPVGRQIRAGYYPAKLVAVGADHLVVVTELQTVGRQGKTGEPVKQFIPIERIKRISFRKTERVLHL